MTFEQEIRAIIADVADLTPDDVSDDAVLKSNLGLDSLELVDLAQQLENRFAIEVADSDVRASMTVRELITLVQSMA